MKELEDILIAVFFVCLVWCQIRSNNVKIKKIKNEYGRNRI